MLDSNRAWESSFFFVRGANWVCKFDEYDTFGDFYDHAWGVLNESGRSSVAYIGPSVLFSLLG